MNMRINRTPILKRKQLNQWLYDNQLEIEQEMKIILKTTICMSKIYTEWGI